VSETPTHPNPFLRTALLLFPFNSPLTRYARSLTGGFWGNVKDVFAIFIIVSLLYSVGNMIRDLVDEKESKIKEGMKMMSLSNSALICSWTVHFGLTFWLIVVGVVFFSADLFVYSDPLLTFVYFFGFMNATMAFAYWVSALFSRAKTAAIVVSKPNPTSCPCSRTAI
jgi:ATP-binding cassette subfamily A (ABC1) protein 3